MHLYGGWLSNEIEHEPKNGGSWPHVLSFLFQSKPQLAGDLQAKNLYQVLIGLLVHAKTCDHL